MLEPAHSEAAQANLYGMIIKNHDIKHEPHCIHRLFEGSNAAVFYLEASFGAGTRSVSLIYDYRSLANGQPIFNDASQFSKALCKIRLT